MKYLNAIILTILFCSVFVSAQIKKVPQDYLTIQSAINSASNGDTILVAVGRYFENVKFNGKNVVLTSNYIFSNNFSDIENTIIDGSNPFNADTASCVRIVNGENSSAVLQGFTITGGKGTKWLDEHGAGLYREGGGILITLSSPTIRNNRIIFNEASDRTGVTSAGGGGIRVGDGNPLIENNIIAYNKGRYGGGVVFNYTGGMLRNNLIIGNTGGEDFGGSGVWILQNGPAPKYLINNTITENVSALSGCGLRVWSTTAVVTNNIIYNNSAPSYADLRTISGSITAKYNNIGGGYSGVGNISVDPIFTQSYSLAGNSPCIDAGDTSTSYNDLENLSNPGTALLPSQGTLRNDMGVFGGPHAKNLPAIPTSVDENFQGALPSGFILDQNFPNPFNPSSVISWRSANADLTTLKIFNLLGKEIATPINHEWKEAGNHKFEFNTALLKGGDSTMEPASGIFFYQLRVGNLTQTKKMIYLK